MKEERRRCELCNSEASIYCPSDSAFLCSNCDVSVHDANFLVARHLRYSLSSSIRHRFHSHLPSSSSSLSNNNIKTTSSMRTTSHYSSTSVTNGASSSTTSKKVIINLNNKKNKTTSWKRTKHDTCSSSVITNGASSPSVTNGGTCSLFVKWSRELELRGVNGNFTAASMALGFCIRKWKGLPFRVAAATSFWFGLKYCVLHDNDKNENQNLITRLEGISGVPAKLILVAHAKLARVFNLHTPHFYYSHFPQQKEEEEEGWDES